MTRTIVQTLLLAQLMLPLMMSSVSGSSIDGGGETPSRLRRRRLEIEKISSKWTSTNNLLCDLGDASATVETSKLKTVDFEFWYAMGTTAGTTTIDNITMFKVEQLLYTNIEEDVLWCTEIKETGEAGATGTVANTNSRHVGVVTFTPGKMDEVTQFFCPTTTRLKDIMKSTNAADCRVVRGEMRILAHAVNDLAAAISGIQNGLEQAMKRGVGQQGELAKVVFLSYLGDTQSEAVSGKVVSARGSETFDYQHDDDDNDDDRSLYLILGFFLSFLVTVFLAALFCSKNDCKREMMAGGFRSKESYACTLVGTGDPPDSFHQGLYHYTSKGQKYLSTKCKGCMDTRSKGLLKLESFDDSDREGMATILEEASCDYSDASYQGEVVLRRADSRHGLAQHHMGHNVRDCGSALCECRKLPETTFLPTPVVRTASFLKAVELSNRRQGSRTPFKRSQLATLTTNSTDSCLTTPTSNTRSGTGTGVSLSTNKISRTDQSLGTYTPGSLWGSRSEE